MGVEEVITAPRSPWQNPFVERVIGSIRRECLDRIIVINERHLRRILSSYVRYYRNHPIALSITHNSGRFHSWRSDNFLNRMNLL
jgi:putative transposase